MTTTATATTSTAPIATRTGLARQAAAVLLAVVALLGIAAATSTPALAGTYAASLDCGDPTLEAPLIARPAQLNAFFYSVNGGDWQTVYIFTSGTESWKWTGAGWSYAGQAGGFHHLFLGAYDQVTAYTYTWIYNGGYQAVGWTYLGSC